MADILSKPAQNPGTLPEKAPYKRAIDTAPENHQAIQSETPYVIVDRLQARGHKWAKGCMGDISDMPDSEKTGVALMKDQLKQGQFYVDITGIDTLNVAMYLEEKAFNYMHEYPEEYVSRMDCGADPFMVFEEVCSNRAIKSEDLAKKLISLRNQLIKNEPSIAEYLGYKEADSEEDE